MEKSNYQLNRIIIVTAVVAVFIGLLALTGWIFGLDSLASIRADYVPMAPATAILSVGFGLIILSMSLRVYRGLVKSLIVSFICLFSLYALLKALEYFTKSELTLDNWVFPVTKTLGQFAVNRSSPVTGFLFFLCGVALLVKILGKESSSKQNLVSGIGMLVLVVGFTGFMGYLVGTPFLYTGDIIPLAILTTVVFILLGSNLIAMGGPRSIFLQHLVGSSPSARILRSVLPIIVFVLLADNIFNGWLSSTASVNHVLSSATFGLILIPLTILVVIQVSKTVFRNAEKAEADRHRAEEALLESERRFRLLVNNLGEGVGLVDKNERFVFANPSADRIFGVPLGGLTGHALQEFLLPDQMSIVLEETQKRGQDEQSTYELDITTPDRQMRNLLVTATPQVSHDGSFTGTFGVFRDITDQKEVEKKLAEFTDELREANATKDRFFSIIAHDLKSPFNSILGFTDLLINEMATSDKDAIEQKLFAIKNSSEAAFNLLENLLSWANSQTGRIQVKPIKIDLEDMIGECTLLFEGQAAQKNIRIEIHCTGDSIALADKQMTHTVIRNLLSNAVKFTRSGGEITVAVKLTGTQYEISVKDNGTGIAADDIPKLFRIDSKVTTLGTAKEKGTGLGLILCKEFVEKNNGTIRVESTFGLGSTFTFTLPQSTQ